MDFKTFSDFVRSVGGKTDGEITGENAKKFVEFYNYWGNYLEATPAYLAYLMQLMGGLAKAFYQICASLEHVFNNLFKLFGLFGYLGDQTTLFGQFFHWFQILGTTLFSFILVASAVTGIFTKPTKYKNVITNFLLVTLVTSVLPLALTTISTGIAQDAQSIQTMSSAGKTEEGYSSLAIQPLKNNVVDLKALVDKDFNTELFPLDNYGYIKPVKEGSTAVNHITDSTDKRDTADFATKIDFSAMYGVSNEKQLDEWKKEISGIKGLFLHKLNANQNGIESIPTHRIVTGLNAFEFVYLRYKVNWIGLFAQYGILIVLLINMSIKFVKSVFDILIEAMISPIQGYSSLSSSKKYKELLRTIGGSLAGVFFEIIIMRITLEVMRDLPTLSVTGIAKLSGGFFDGMNMWEQCLSACVVYIGLFFSAMQGVTMIERWLGVSTGHNETAQQLIGAMMMGNAFASGAGAVGSGIAGLATGGASLAMQAPSAIAGTSKVIGNSLANTGGGLKGLSNAVKDQGVGNTFKGGVSNATDLATIMARREAEKVGKVVDGFGQKAEDAQKATYNAVKDDSAVHQPAWKKDGFFGDSEYTLNAGGNNYGEDFYPSGGVSDPSASSGGKTTDSSSKAPNLDSSQKKTPKNSPSTNMKIKQSLQQAQMAGGRMSQQSQTKGAEMDEEE